MTWSRCSKITLSRKVLPLLHLSRCLGFKTVFQKNSSPRKTCVIPRDELFGLSHQVPTHLLTCEEGENAAKGCLELDPAAAPLELLQVLTVANGGDQQKSSGR
ncbi:hypothetical protein PTKIN_Ptkin04bG0026800 [Pterospermum kingtungense]